MVINVYNPRYKLLGIFENLTKWHQIKKSKEAENYFQKITYTSKYSEMFFESVPINRFRTSATVSSESYQNLKKTLLLKKRVRIKLLVFARPGFFIS